MYLSVILRNCPEYHLKTELAVIKGKSASARLSMISFVLSFNTLMTKQSLHCTDIITEKLEKPPFFFAINKIMYVAGYYRLSAHDGFLKSVHLSQIPTTVVLTLEITLLAKFSWLLIFTGGEKEQ